MSNSDYLKGWNEASLFLNRLDSLTKKIWIKNPEVKGGGYWQEREIAKEAAPKQKTTKRTKKEVFPSLKQKAKTTISPSPISQNIQPIQSKYINFFSPVSEYTAYSQPKVEQSIVDFEEKVRFNNFETLAIVDPKTGNLVYEQTGESHSVTVPWNETKKHLNCIRIHNHPSLANDNIKTNLTEEKINNEEIPIGFLGHGFSIADVVSAIRSGGTTRVTTLAYDYQLEIPETVIIPSLLAKNFSLRRYDLKHDKMNALFRQEISSFISEKQEETKQRLKQRKDVPLGTILARRKERPDSLVFICDSAHETMYDVFSQLNWNYKKMRNSTPDHQVKEQLLSQFSPASIPENAQVKQDAIESSLGDEDNFVNEVNWETRYGISDQIDVSFLSKEELKELEND